VVGLGRDRKRTDIRIRMGRPVGLVGGAGEEEDTTEVAVAGEDTEDLEGTAGLHRRKARVAVVVDVIRLEARPAVRRG